MKRDDRSLLLATHRGHDAAARCLWDRFAPGLLRFAGGLMRDQSAAEDVVQAAFCRILELDRATVASVREVRPWLFGLVRHAALNSLRTGRRLAERESRSTPGPTSAPAEPSPELARAIETLSPDHHEIVMLRHVAGLTFDEAAQVLNENRNTLAGRYRRALECLREMLCLPDDRTDPFRPLRSAPEVTHA